MSGSGAGLNRVYAVVLKNLTTASTPVASPLTAYGTIGINDSGPVMNEAMGFTKWTFSQIGGASGYSVTLYGTVDPVAYGVWRQSLNPGQPIPNVPAQIPPSSWFVLPGQVEQSGTGNTGNPMTAQAPIFQFSGTLLAVRAVLTDSQAPVGSLSIAVEAVP